MIEREMPLPEMLPPQEAGISSITALAGADSI
jgi:hypothetical protein